MDIYFKDNKQVFADFKGFTIKTDQSVQSGGKAEFPEPFTLFLASLGTCAGIYVKSFCDQRNISTENIRLSQEQIFDQERKILANVDITIHVPADFPQKYEGAVIQAASLCLVKRHLRDEIQIKVSLERALT
jgi:ribosomal protein S12 methylthiotransferase accessory factor